MQTGIATVMVACIMVAVISSSICTKWVVFDLDHPLKKMSFEDFVHEMREFLQWVS